MKVFIAHLRSHFGICSPLKFCVLIIVLVPCSCASSAPLLCGTRNMSGVRGGSHATEESRPGPRPAPLAWHKAFSPSRQTHTHTHTHTHTRTFRWFLHFGWEFHPQKRGQFLFFLAPQLYIKKGMHQGSVKFVVVERGGRGKRTGHRHT